MDGPFNRGITRQKLAKNDQNGQRTDPSTGEFQEKSAKNERNLQNPVKNVRKPRNRQGASRNTRGSLTRYNVALCTNFHVTYHRFTLGSPMKTRTKRTV